MAICDHCGQEIKKLNPHTICKQKIQLLIILGEVWNSGVEWAQVKEGYLVVGGDNSHRAPYCARQHADRLKWFNLVNHRGPRTGEYQINQNGVDFLQGRISVPKTIYCREGRVVEESPERVFIGDVRGIVLGKRYWDNYAAIQVEA